MCDERIFDSEEPLEDQVTVSLYPEILEHYKAGIALTDDELDTIADLAVDILKSILQCFGETDCVIDEYEGDEGELILNVLGGDLAILIGRHGRVLDSLQMLVSSLLARKLAFRYPINVDIEGYKARRKEKVISIALSAADRSLRYGKPQRLKPMTAYERRLVHMALADNPCVQTASSGIEPYRFVIVEPVDVEEAEADL